jgi:hypothetical protein
MIKNIGKDVEKLESLHLFVGVTMKPTLWKKSWQFLNILNMELLYDPKLHPKRNENMYS